MAVIRIYRLESIHPAPRPTKAVATAVRERLARLARVSRDAVVDHFSPQGRAASSFYKQQAVPASVINNPAERRYTYRDAGWVVPPESLGRAARADRSTAESLRLWINKHLSPEMVHPSHVAVVVDDE
jgi:hypothetical protein